MTYTQAPAACKKNIFHLFCFTQPVKITLQLEQSVLVWLEFQ